MAKSLVPNKVLHSLRARFPAETSAEAPTPSESPDEPEPIQRHRSPSNNSNDFLTIEWLRGRVAEIQDPALKTYFSITSDSGKPSLCASADSYQALIDSVIAVSGQSNLEIGYMLNRRRVVASDDAQLSRDLISKPFAQIRLVSHDQEFAFFIENWQIEGRTLVAPRPNPVTKNIQLGSTSADAFFEAPGKNLDELYPTPLMDECDFDVDVVYTWVDSEDPDWRELFAEYADSSNPPTKDENGSPGGDLDADRFLSRDELRYSLRSLLKFAPWVRHVYIVSNCKPPEWFDDSNQRVLWIYHDQLIDAALLPTFNSHAIETSIHRIPNLSEQFLYFNDDLFVMRPVKKLDFFFPNGIAKIRPEPYGIVHGEVDPNDPDYINAARNVQALLQSEFGKTATRPHTHSPQSMKRSVAQASEETFAEAFEITRSNRFRSITDISPTSFLYPNFAYLTGKALMDFPKTALMNANHPFREELKSYSVMLDSENFADLPLTLCINDGGGSTQNEDWGHAIVDFMHSTFDEVSEAEKTL